MSLGVSILLIFILIFLNGFFSAAEVSYISCSMQRIEQDLEDGRKTAVKVLKLMKSPSNFFSTAQIIISLIGFINGVISSRGITDKIIPLINSNNLFIPVLLNAAILIILTFFQVVLGELVPKEIGLKYPEKIAYFSIHIVTFLAQIFRPLVWFFTISSRLIARMIGIKVGERDDRLSEEDIRLMVQASEKVGKIEEEESEMIDNIFEFNDTTVDEIMTHRTEVSAIRNDFTIDEILDFVSNEKYTRFPVYNESIDNIIGTLHAKDLLAYVDAEKRKSFKIEDLLRAPYYVPDSKNISELFKVMKESKTHIAIVIDEYGGTAGIITIEDLIEEIVGNIFDEYDDIEEEIEEVSKDEYIIDGLVNLDDVEEELKIGLPVEDYDTLSGFIIGQIGRFVEDEEKIVINFKGYDFIVLEVDDKVITSVKVVKVEEKDIKNID